MKRAAILVIATVLVLLGLVAWHFFSSPARNAAAAYAAIFPTGPVACPDDPNNLSAIEGWAPGAGKASEAGAANAQSMGGMGGALGGESTSPAPSAAGCTGLSAAQIARFDTIAAAAKSIPTDGFDPGARADELADIDAAFAFVRDRIATEAYAGAMRGAAGTLQARGGSPADKALLLAALLGAKDIPVRFVHAPLSDADTAALIGAVLAPAPSPAPQDLSAAFKTLGVDPAQARAGAAAVRARYDAAADRTIAAAAAPTDALAALLKSGNAPLAADDAALRARWSANLHDHWWLQAQENGAWVDLDPTAAGPVSGKHLGAAPAADGVDALPDDVTGTLTVRLTATRVAAGGMQTVPLVARVLKLTDVDAEPVVVTVGDRSAGSTGIAQATSFTPSIGVADSEQTGDPFTTDGLASVDLEIAVQQPGGTERTYRRTIVDRRASDGKSIDPAWTQQRTAYALTGIYDILPVTGDLDPGFTGLREIAGLQMVQAVMAYGAAGGSGKQMPPPASERYPMGALHFFEYGQIVRRRMETGGVRFFFDRPLIALEHRGFTLDGGKQTGVDQFDIVDNAMDAEGTAATPGARANLTRGYVETFAEQHLFSAPNDGGTIALMEAARHDGVPLAVLNGPQYGGTAVAPQKPVTLGGRARTGWWQIDPATGNAVGRMGPAGAGQELAEYAIARANDWSTLYSMIQFYGDFFRCIAGAVEAPLSGDLGTQEGFKQCAASAICSYMDGVGSGYVLGDAGFTDLEALLYNILDLSIPGTKDSLPPTGGAICSGLFHSPLYP
jgi:transglutaminase-like putative cysteine protease